MLALPLEFVPAFESRIEATFLGGTFTKRRDALAIALGLCGLRWEEVSRIEVRDLDPPRLFVRTAKRGVPRVLPIGDRVSVALAVLVHDSRRWRRLHPRARVFVSGLLARPLSYEQVKRSLRDWTRLVFGRPYTFHCLRHTAAVRCYQASRDVLMVQRLLGHRSLMWTERYLRSLATVEVVGLPGFVDGAVMKPRLFDGEVRVEDEAIWAQRQRARADGFADGALGGAGRAVRVVQKVVVGCVAPVTMPVVPAFPLHDCTSSQIREWVEGLQRWRCTCSVCGRYVGELPAAAGELPGQLSLF